MFTLLWIAISLATISVLAYKHASLSVWSIGLVVLLAFITKFSNLSNWALILDWSVLGLFLIAFNISSIRRNYITQPIFKIYKSIMPSMSKTEREALEAGTVSWEGDLFAGHPNVEDLLKKPTHELSQYEREFIDGPVNELCSMLDDWDITHNRTDLPPEVWQFIKDKGFLGMIIPKSYGGLELSATAQAEILMKIYGVSVTAATTVSVPNSLGPAELLLKYGTEAQKDYYLPRLAKGTEIPCFALTAPSAGSDAASIPDNGVVCKEMFEGKETLGIRLNWDKRYITLCPVATVIGLAFRLFDPQGLLGDKKEVGITCALIPASTNGVTSGRRHFPLNSAFLNGPTQGENVFIPIDWVIGGQKMVGNGWRMLMECLSAGRAISLPSSAVGGARMAALTSTAYSVVRNQFGSSIVKFEGIEEVLARIVGNTYIIDSALTMTAAAIDHGQKPSVASAILKYHTTQRAREIAMDAMDIHGGKGICLGPKNYIGRGYQQSPIAITVEGANILTRSLIIFGQGAMRCHPYVFEELEAGISNDLGRFDKALWGHVGGFISHFFRSFILGLSDARWVKVNNKPIARPVQLLTRYSANLGFMADLFMVALGSDLKRKEKISARLGDMLSYLYLLSSVIKRYHDAGFPKDQANIVAWATQSLSYEIEESINSLFLNFPNRILGRILRRTVMPWGVLRSKPRDSLGSKLVKQMIDPNCSLRKSLCENTYSQKSEGHSVWKLEEAFVQIIQTKDLERSVIKAAKEGKVQGLHFRDKVQDALDKGILSQEQASKLFNVEALRAEVIAVDDFDPSELAREHRVSIKESAKKAKAHKKKAIA